jgi:SSS family solute:Na+ symporter
VIQVFFLVLGGLITTWLAVSLVSETNGGNSIGHGLSVLGDKASGHFDMVFARDNPNYIDLPGLTILLGGMWIVNLNYWGCNQYITQRALGADLPTARKGLLFAAFLKLLMPVIVVLPGIAAFVLHQQGGLEGMMHNGEINPDRAYPVLLNLLPSGLKGVAFAALVAAVVASLAGKANSIATIFALDIYKKRFNVNADENKMVSIGRVTVVVSMLAAVLIAPFMGIDKKGGFQYIQEYTGFVSPGILAMFLMGFFWKKTTADAAMFATIGGFIMSLVLKFLPGMMDLSFLAPIGFSLPVGGTYEIPFLDRMFIVFCFVVIGMIIISLMQPNANAGKKEIIVDTSMFKVDTGFAIGSLIIIAVLTVVYTVWW